MAIIDIELHISPDQMQRYYSGHAGAVRATACDGRKVQFPANILRPFVTREGVQGRYRLEMDELGKLIRISKQPDQR